MIDPSVPLQKAIYDALTAEFADGAARVYDDVPTAPDGKLTAQFPYVEIGDDQIRSDADQCHDACTAFATVQVWSRAVGKVEVKTLMARVCRVLDVNLDVEGFGVITHGVEAGPQPVPAGDGRTRRSVVTFYYRMAPVPA